MGKVKNELKAMLPTLRPSEVKRFYLPPHEAVVHELEENGYAESVGYLRELLDLDEESANETDPGAITWERPRLRDNKSALARLKEGLIAFEKAKSVGDSVSTATAFLNTAVLFQRMMREWWWVAERLYRSALANAELTEDRQTIAVTRYLYGRFLFEQMRDTAKSLDHLKAAWEASRQKTWNASKLTGRKEETVFRECNGFLYRVLLLHARQSVSDRPDVAVQACTEALERAIDSGHHEYTSSALYELGKCQLRSGDAKQAFRSFSKLLATAKRIPDPEGVCNAHTALAFAYKLRELDDDANAERHLRLLRENAAEFGFTSRLAQAHYFSGEHFLSKRRPDIATPHLETSFKLYCELGLHDEANKARTIAAVSKGQETIDQYIDLVLRCETADSRAISTLCRWKTCRGSFWNEKKQLQDTDSEELGFERTASSPSTPISAVDIAKTPSEDLI